MMVLLWPVGMLLLFVGVLFYNRRELRAGEARRTSAKAARFLTSGFRNEFFYWELVELSRRLLVTGWVRGTCIELASCEGVSNLDGEGLGCGAEDRER